MPNEAARLSRLDDVTVRFFEKAATRKKFPKNTILFSKGDKSDSLHILCSGKAKVVARDEQGKEIVIAVIGPGEYFGEIKWFVLHDIGTKLRSMLEELRFIHRYYGFLRQWWL